MEEPEDRVLLCRQCGKEFAFTISEQEYYKEKGWSQPKRCPQCRSVRRMVSMRICSICSICGGELAEDKPSCCSACLENIKREAENKLCGLQKRIEELESKLKNAGEMEKNLASAMAEIEKSQQTNNELRDRVKALEVENLKLNEEKTPRHSLEASIQQLNEHFQAFQQSYACDIDKLVGLLMEVQSALRQRQDASLLHRVRLAFIKKANTDNKNSGNLGIDSERLAQDYPQNEQHNRKEITNTKDATRI